MCLLRQLSRRAHSRFDETASGSIKSGIALAGGAARRTPSAGTQSFEFLKWRATPQPEAAATPVTRCGSVLLQIRWRLRCLARRGGDRSPALGEPNAVGAIFDQPQHLEAQALGRRQRNRQRRRRRCSGNGTQDLVFLGPERDVLAAHDRLANQRGLRWEVAAGTCPAYCAGHWELASLACPSLGRSITTGAC